MSEKEKPIQGTREWAVASIDCCLGCPNGCKYCYGRFDQVVRKKIVSADTWSKTKTLEDELTKKHPQYSGQVMFPTNHDIVPENLDSCLLVLKNLLAANNQVLVVTKPRLSCIETLCQELSSNKDNILFRFTITARNSEILSVWEPSASTYQERLASIAYAFNEGFQTSVSIEPMLDSSDVVGMVRELLPFISHSVWIGKMNKIDERVENSSTQMNDAIVKIKKGQTDEEIFKIYHQLKDEPLVRWKESIKDIVGLKRATISGQDI